MAASRILLPASLFPPRSSTALCITGIRRIRASLQAQNPSRRPVKRKNHLRQKLLNTLTKPYLSLENLPLPDDQNENTSLVENPINLVEGDELQFQTPCLPEHIIGDPNERVEDLSHQDFGQTCRDAQEKELSFQTQLANSQALPELNSVSFRSVLSLVLGLFVVETAVALWIFRAADVTSEEISSGPEVLGVEIENGNGKAKKLMKWNGHLNSKAGIVPCMDELKLSDKVMEIRAMAREARNSEQKKLQKDAIQENGDEIDPETELATARAAVQKEIDHRLLKTRKNLEKRSVKPLSGDRETSEKQPNKPKGFQKSKDNRNTTETRKKTQNGNIYFKAETNGVDCISLQSDSLHLEKAFDPLKGDEIQEKLDVKAPLNEEQEDVWWHKLPYVLVILLRRGSDHQGGFYSLKTSPSADDDIVSYTVAFEDRGDASNFCFLLESFFEDLADFRADVVPLSIKELQREIRSSSKKVIVVRKGRLQLYAGQPLIDVEMALRAIDY
ncbi:uncharacterized protein [Aristolochia californica]|uniref:uncharacterized protein n=1 Tax=Aristolochia californica TaxID=171875 RepID=UPI0035E0916C